MTSVYGGVTLGPWEPGPPPPTSEVISPALQSGESYRWILLVLDPEEKKNIGGFYGSWILKKGNADRSCTFWILKEENIVDLVNPGS